jgi:hypothetical protein
MATASIGVYQKQAISYNVQHKVKIQLKLQAGIEENPPMRKNPFRIQHTPHTTE